MGFLKEFLKFLKDIISIRCNSIVLYILRQKYFTLLMP